MPRPPRKATPRKPAVRITEEREKAFLTAVKMGVHASEAARMIGVTPSAISARKQRDPVFAEACARAESGCEMGLVLAIQSVARKDWKAAAWLLERRFSDRWARPEIRAEINQTQIDVQVLVAGVQSAMSEVAKIHADFTQPDAEDDLDPDALPAPSPDLSQSDDDDAGVTRS